MSAPTENKEGINTDVLAKWSFNKSSESERWAIRVGEEPVDAFDIDFFEKMGFPELDKIIEKIAGKLSGMFGFSHSYVEVGKINEDGEFETKRRLHAVGLDEEMEMGGSDSRLVGVAVGGESMSFEKDKVYQDDPHATKHGQLTHADTTTEMLFVGTEREVLQVYGSMLDGMAEINNADHKYSLTGLSKEAPNSNSALAEMIEKGGEAAEQLGIADRYKADINPEGIAIGSSTEMETSKAQASGAPIEDLRAGIDAREALLAEQYRQVEEKGIAVDLDVTLPQQPASQALAMNPK